MGRALVFSLISAFFHFVVIRWLEQSFPRLRRFRARIALGVAAFIVLGLLSRVATIFGVGRAGASVGVVFASEAAFVAIVALLIMLVMLAVDIPYRIIGLGAWLLRRNKIAPAEGESTVKSAASADVSSEGQVPELTRRAAIERAAGLVLVSTTGGLFGWGAIKGRVDFETNEVVVRLPGLPRALEGYTIVQVSDLHVGTFCGDDHLKLGFEGVIKSKPDLIVATGDLVDHDPAYAKKMADALASLGGIARDGVSAILGNHDHYADSEKVTAALRGSGVNVLVNEGRIIRPGDGGGFSLLGVDDISSRRHGGGPHLERARAMTPGDRPIVLLSHQPTTVDLWLGRVGLQLSGHTHGGQINPGGFSIAKSIVRLPYVHGLYQIAGGTTLYVNRGFGTSGAPVRVSARPEVTKIILVSG